MIDLEQMQRDIKDCYKRLESPDPEERIGKLIHYIKEEYALPEGNFTLPEIKMIVNIVLNEQTEALQSELEALLVEKERIARQIERKSALLQAQKHELFHCLETQLDNTAEETKAMLHQVKLQSLDLFDMLAEIVESAIITTLEKNHEIEETVEEISKEITHETLGEGPLQNDRIRLVIGTILHTAVEVSEATPNQAEAILRGTLKGVRSGLVKAIRKLKKELLFMPDELKLTESMPKELLRSDVLFTQILRNEELRCSPESSALLEKLSKEIRFDLEELVEVSRETVDLMKAQLSQALSRSQMLNSKTAIDAKRVGISAWRSAKTALEGALQNAKGKMDRK